MAKVKKKIVRYSAAVFEGFKFILPWHQLGPNPIFLLGKSRRSVEGKGGVEIKSMTVARWAVMEVDVSAVLTRRQK